MWQHTFAFVINALFSQSDCIQLYLNECFVFDREWEREGVKKREWKWQMFVLLIEIQTNICLLIWYRFQRVKIANFKFYAIDSSQFADHFRYNFSRLNITFICLCMCVCAWYVIEAPKSYHGNIIWFRVQRKPTNQPDSVCIQKHIFRTLLWLFGIDVLEKHIICKTRNAQIHLALLLAFMFLAHIRPTMQHSSTISVKLVFTWFPMEMNRWVFSSLKAIFYE